MRKLKIAQISTPFISVPPKGYGGIELVVANLTEGLVRRGHEVTLFAPGGSKTSAKLISPFQKVLDKRGMEELFSPLAIKLFWLHSLPSLYHAVVGFEKAEEFDIIHNHFHYLGLILSSLVKTPTVHTYHGDFSSAVKSPIEKLVLEKYKESNWTAISESQKRNSPVKLKFIDVIYHGLPVEDFEFSYKSGDYLMWLGRITPRKGLSQAIEVAKRLGKKLIIAGVVNPRDNDYFEKKIRLCIDGKLIKFVGALNHTAKVKYLKKAFVLLYPVSWEEPFGLVMTEAMATGTPVVGFKNGAVPEVVRDGVTGFIIDSKKGVKGLVEAVKKMEQWSSKTMEQCRYACRKHVEENFSIKKMVEGYEGVYEQILKQRQPG